MTDVCLTMDYVIMPKMSVGILLSVYLVLVLIQRRFASQCFVLNRSALIL